MNTEKLSKSIEQGIETIRKAQSGASLMNDMAVIVGFSDKGISEPEINPRVNVFTYNAWRALGRQVRKGEHGVKITTYVQASKEDKETGESDPYKFPRTTTVFHVSQTDPIQTATAYPAPCRSRGSGLRSA